MNDNYKKLYMLGSACHLEGNYEEAISYYKKALEVEPQNTSVFVGMGSSYLEQKKYNKAMLYYGKALDVEPQNNSAIKGYGYSSRFKENPEYLDKVYKTEHNLGLSLITKDFIEHLAEFIETNKMVSLGLVTAGLAHEIKQPLTIIQLTVYNLLDEENLSKEELKEELTDIEKQATRINNLIKHFQTLARSESVNFEYVNVNQIIHRAFDMFYQRLRINSIDVNLEQLDDTIELVFVNPIQLEQVFINLISNAKDALEEVNGGTITVSTKQEKDTVKIYFSDTGKGITEDHKEHIFTPFFTTKEVGKGTGLGLWLCYTTIKQMNGDVKVESELGKGTTFIISLPVQGDK